MGQLASCLQGHSLSAVTAQWQGSWQSNDFPGHGEKPAPGGRAARICAELTWDADWNGTVKGQEGVMTGLKHSPSWSAFTPFPSPFCPISSPTACDTETCLPAWHSFFQLLPPSLKRSDQLQHPQGYRGSSGSSLSPLCHGYHRDMKKLAF